MALEANMELLATVTSWATRVDARIAALPHALAEISALLDGSVRYTPPCAAKTGSVALLKRVLGRVKSNGTDPALVMHWTACAMKTSIKSGNLEMVRLLHRSHPEPLGIDSFLLAATAGHLQILQWLFVNRCDKLCCPRPPREFTHGELQCCLAQVHTRAGWSDHVRIVEWLIGAGYIRNTDGTGDLAIRSRDVEFAERLYQYQVPNAFRFDVARHAVTNGDLVALRFLHERRMVSPDLNLMDIAILNDHKDIVDFLQENYPNEVMTVNIVGYAASMNRLDIVQQDHEYMRDPNALTNAMNRASMQGYTHIVKWISQTHGLQCSTFDLTTAARKGDLDFLQWVHENKCGDWPDNIVHQAAASGKLELVKWLYAHRVSESWRRVMDSAAGCGHIDVVEWLHEEIKDADCTVEAMDEAAADGHLEVVQWLHTYRTEGCTKNAMNNAAKNGHLHVIKWLHEHREEGCTVAAMDQAAANNHLEVIIWLHENRTEGCSKWAMSNTSLAITKWLYAHRTESCHPSTLTLAARSGDLARLRFLREVCQVPLRDDVEQIAIDSGHRFITEWLQEHIAQAPSSEATTEARNETLDNSR